MGISSVEKFKRTMKLIVGEATYDRAKSAYRSSMAIKRDRRVDLSIPPGVNLIGYLRAGMGLGEGCRLLAWAIDEARIPYCAINFSKNNISRELRGEWPGKIARRPLYRADIVHVNPDQYRLFETELPRSLWKGRYVIGFLLWELPRLPGSWREGLKLLDEVWVPSNFIAGNIRSQLDLPVRVIPYGIPPRTATSAGRSELGLPEGRFLFLVLYDVASIMERKNPKGAVEAFKRAFSPGDERVGIVIKVNNSRHSPGEIAELRASLKGYEGVRFLERTLSRDEVDALIKACDALVSLHRSEGFGLTLAEAMSFGKPVVATNWSANTEFMDEGNSCPVNYRLANLNIDHGHYEAAGQRWADPDLDHAASLMRRLVEDREYRESISRRAHESIFGGFSLEASGSRIRARLGELGLLK